MPGYVVVGKRSNSVILMILTKLIQFEFQKFIVMYMSRLEPVSEINLFPVSQSIIQKLGEVMEFALEELSGAIPSGLLVSFYI